MLCGDMVETSPREGDPILRAFKALAHAATRYHRATLEGAEHLPRGAALLVGNHGLFGLETPIFFYLLNQATGRLPIGLADREVFGRGWVRRLLTRLGGVTGTRENAIASLRCDQLVVCYPGGAREVFKDPDQAYRLRWEERQGFAWVAQAAGVPIIPFAGLGVDESYFNFGRSQRARFRIGSYAAPVALGLGPFPLPVHFHFKLGRPVFPEPGVDPAVIKSRVQDAVEGMLHS
jgi:1-acyl-sn-glycerol-3-phosphate acyltransferase